MYLFTKGQCKRMRAIFSAGGARHEILASTALTNTGKARPVETQAAETVKMISVFPNPAVSAITIDLGIGNNDISTIITIYSSIGQPVMTQTIMGSRSVMNISGLKAGIYFIKQANNGVMTKFVKN